MPEVSILIPTHNRAETIKPAIMSALGQTFTDLEVIVYDDGSDHKDGMFDKGGKVSRVSPPTEKIINGIKDKRLKYVKCKDNHGTAWSRNKLLELATGEYCAWLDSDDVSNKWRIEICLEAIKRFKRPYVRTAITTFGVKAGHTWELPPILVYRGGVSFATVLFRRELAIPFDTEYSCCCEDMDWELRFAATHGRSVNVPLTLYGVGRRSPDRLTMRYKQEIYEAPVNKDKARFAKMCEKYGAVMIKNGTTKMPLHASWDFISGWLNQFYSKYYRKQADEV